MITRKYQGLGLVPAARRKTSRDLLNTGSTSSSQVLVLTIMMMVGIHNTHAWETKGGYDNYGQHALQDDVRQLAPTGGLGGVHGWEAQEVQHGAGRHPKYQVSQPPLNCNLPL